MIVSNPLLVGQMSGQRYKRTNFDEDELTPNGGTPPPTDYSANVVFKGGWLSWQRRTNQERVLLVVLVLMTFTLIVLASLLAVKDSTIKDLRKQGSEGGMLYIVSAVKDLRKQRN